MKRNLTRNSETLDSFEKYCREHPYERFWQALRNWSRYNFVLATDNGSGFNRDTFNWEGRRHDEILS